MNQQIQSKLFDDKKASEEVQNWKSKGLKVGFTNGCFDILHLGHIDYLSKAANLVDKLIVGINSDDSVKRLKGPSRPLQDENSRAIIMASLSIISAVVIFHDDTPGRLIELLLPDMLFKGGDYSIDGVVGAKTVIKNGGKVILLPFLNGHSTSKIEQKIKALTE